MTTRYCCTLLLIAGALSAADGPLALRVDDHVYRGRQPRRDELPELAKIGIRTVLDLRGGPVHEPREKKEVEAAGMQYVGIRLSGLFAPTYGEMSRILSVLQDAKLRPVFVHCRRGDDRAGMVIACYCIVHDHWTNEQTFAEARDHGISRLELLMRNYVRHFDSTRLQTSGSN